MTHDAVGEREGIVRAYSLTHLKNVKIIIRRRGVFVGVGGELRKFNFYRHILTHKHTHKSRYIIPKYYMFHCCVARMDSSYKLNGTHPKVS